MAVDIARSAFLVQAQGPPERGTAASCMPLKRLASPLSIQQHAPVRPVLTVARTVDMTRLAARASRPAGMVEAGIGLSMY